MVSERLVNRFEESLTELAEISGGKERTGIVPNLEVIDAAPGITGFIIVEDSKDGDYITAATVPGIVYANGDLVNVLFIEGTEPIAYQQSSGSTGVAFAVDRVYRPDFTATVLTGDNSNDVTLTAGDLIIPDDIVHSGDTDTLISLEIDKIVIQSGGVELAAFIEDAQDEVVINDGSVDVDFRVETNNQTHALFVRGSDDLVGIRTSDPQAVLDVAFSGGTPTAIFGDGSSNAFIHFDGAAATVRDMRYQSAGVNRWIFRVNAIAEGGSDAGSDFEIISRTDAGAQKDRIFYITRDTARVGIQNTTPSAKLDIDQDSTTAAISVIRMDQADVSEPFIDLIGTAAAATLTQSLVDEGDVTTATRVGWYKINVNDVGNQITDGDYWVPFYSLA